jgi:hypothetical protein
MPVCLLRARCAVVFGATLTALATTLTGAQTAISPPTQDTADDKAQPIPKDGSAPQQVLVTANRRA